MSGGVGSAAAIRFVDAGVDPWRPLAAGAVPTAHCLLTLDAWRALGDTAPSTAPLGIALPNDADVEALDGELGRIALVALAFPRWTDGRAYSQARLLRARLGFSGEVRATGDVVADMLPLLVRTGFDAVVLRADQSIDVARRALAFFPRGHYQGDVHEPVPRFARAAP